MPTTVEPALIQLIRTASPFSGPAEKMADFDQYDWPRLVTAASVHGLAPLLFAALKRSDHQFAIPAIERERLRWAYVRSSVSSRFAFQELSRWLDYFKRNQIPVIVLKGGALALTLYDDSSMRPMGDLDLLIPRDSMAQAQAALIEEGYQASIEMARGFKDRFCVEQSFVRLDKRPAQIDLHWHAFTSPYYSERIPIEWFWRRTVEYRVNTRHALTLSPTAQLLYLSAHYMLHDFKRLIWSYDLALLIARRRQHIDCDEAIAAATKFGLVPILANTLAEVREYWGVALPTLELRLHDLHTTWKERTIVALMSNGIGLPGELSLRGTRKKLAYSLRVLFPSPEYLRKRYQLRRPGLLPLCYLWRVGKSAGLISRVGLYTIGAAFRSRAPRGYF
jgi:transposase